MRNPRKQPAFMRYLVTISFVLAILTACSRQPSVSQRDPQSALRDMLLHAQTEALQARIVLTELREGHFTNALELLEMQVDTSVIMIDHSLPSLSASERNDALGTLRVLKSYREAHPRRQEASIQDVSAADAQSLIEGSQKAAQILKDLK